ncbi:MAG: hypothetical protein IT320_19030 [Anaerolineae bacterium]|nr:hypothetical protein [Anaerolineae bacterium]
MLDDYQTVGILIFGVVFVVSGSIATIRRKITFRYRRGTPNPSAVGTLSGTPAVTYGVSALTSGVIMVLPIVLSAMNVLDRSWLTITSVIGIGLFVLGSLFAVLIQISFSWGQRMNEDANKVDKTQN